jgi:protein-disulfide isomerase
MGKDRVEAGRGRRANVVAARKRQQSKKPFYAALALIALVGAGALAWVVSRPEEGPRTADPNLPPATAEGYLLGRPDAQVQVLEFADFECPACANFAVVTEPDVRKRLVDQGIVSLRFFDYPLPMHKNTWDASHAAACANDQGKFWEMHDRIFLGQNDWNTQASRNPKGIFERYARELNLNADTFEECYDSRRHQRKIEAHKAEAERRTINQTPTFVFGSRIVPGAIGYDEFKALVDSVRATNATAGAATPGTAPATGAVGDTTKAGSGPARP